MTTGQPGRRDNGLAAADWGALVDLDPRLSDSLLERLAGAGVAAYVEPAGGVDTMHRGVTLPDRPLDRLWVDVSRAEAARTVITALGGELDGQDLVRAVPRGSARRVLAPPKLGPAHDPTQDDAAFQQIVEGFHTSSSDPVPSWPVEEDVGLSTTPDTPTVEPPPHRRRRDDLPDWVEPEEIEPDEDDHYVPPPPPPLKRFKVTTVVFVGAVLLGVIAAFTPGLVGLPDGNDSRLLGMLLIAAGAGMLVLSLHEGSSDDDPDDGAVV